MSDTQQADELETIVAEEFRLKETLPFGAWLRHVRDNHMALCETIRAKRPLPKSLTVDLLTLGKDSPMIRTTCELPNDCHRIVIDEQDVGRPVWGFRYVVGEPDEKYVGGTIVSRGPCYLVG